MDVLVQKLLMNLLIWVLQLVDGILNIFRQLAGLEYISVANEEMDLIGAVLNNQLITKVFFGILVVAVVVCAIAMITAIVKAMANVSGKERKSIAKITGQGLGTVFISLIMAGIMVTGITIANSFLKDIDAAFGLDDKKISNYIFDISVGQKYDYIPELEWEMIPGTNEYKYDIHGNRIPVYVTDQNGDIVYDDNGNPKQKVSKYIRVETGQTGWNTDDGKMPLYNADGSVFDITQHDADTIFGKFPRDFLGMFEQGDKDPLSDYLVRFGSFNFLLAYFAGIIILVAVASACLGLVKRIYDIVILFLSLPLMVSTIPLDDGARFKVWRETVISKVIIAYGAVFAVNVFLLIIPIIMQIDPAYNVLKMLLVVGGGLSISGGILLFARLFGTDAAESRDMAQSARTLLAGGMAGMHGIKMVGATANKIVGSQGIGGDLVKGIFGGRNPLNTVNASQSPLTVGVGSSGVSAMSNTLGNTMTNAGVQSGTWHRDPTTGRFISAEKALSLAKQNSLTSKGAKK